MSIAPRKEAASAASSHHAEPAAVAVSAADCRPQPERIVTVLAISPYEDDHVFLSNAFGHSKWHIYGVRTWREALTYLSEHVTAVVVCERDLPDCSWREVLSELGRLPGTPVLIVTSRLADDELWAEVLNLGGYDVLMKPFDQAEVFRVISLAWLNWKGNWERLRTATDPAHFAIAAGM